MSRMCGLPLSGNGDQYLLTERDAASKVLHVYRRTVPNERILPREHEDSVSALTRRIDSLPVLISRLEGVPPNVVRLELPQTYPLLQAATLLRQEHRTVRREADIPWLTQALQYHGT